MDASEGSRGRRLGVGAALIAVLVAASIAVAVGAVRSAAEAPEVVDVPLSTPAAVAVYVHVHGAVTTPGLYRLSEGARVVDAVAAAGGLTDDADAGAVNLARTLLDGEQVRVPVIGETPPAAGADSAGRVRVNAADAAALETLPGIGPALAQRIIAWRTDNGPFRSVEDLLAVPGIGEKVLAGLRDLVTL